MPDVNAAAAVGFSREALSYARARPDYPPEILQWMADPLGVQAGSNLLDLGAGTGKFTKLLLRTGARVVAAEPVAPMLEQLRAALPEVEAIAATAQALPLAGASLDAVVCAQAFHWFADTVTLREIHRVLRPTGNLGLIWNVRDESVDWVRQISAIITPHEGGVPRFHSGSWRRAFTGGLFSAPELRTFRNVHAGDPQSVIVERIASVSFIAAMNKEDRNAVLEQLRNLISTHPDLRGRSTVEFPYLTHAYCCRKLTDSGLR